MLVCKPVVDYDLDVSILTKKNDCGVREIANCVLDWSLLTIDFDGHISWNIDYKRIDKMFSRPLPYTFPYFACPHTVIW